MGASGYGEARSKSARLPGSVNVKMRAGDARLRITEACRWWRWQKRGHAALELRHVSSTQVTGVLAPSTTPHRRPCRFVVPLVLHTNMGGQSKWCVRSCAATSASVRKLSPSVANPQPHPWAQARTSCSSL